MNIIKFKEKILPEVQIISKNMASFSAMEADILIECHKLGMTVAGTARLIADKRLE